MAAGCGVEGSQLLPSDPGAYKSTADSQEVGWEDLPKGLHRWVEQKQPLERRFCSSARIIPSGPKWEASNDLGSPTLSKKGNDGCR